MPEARSKPVKPSPYQIAAFTHAARERSFTRAAERLGVTQSSVTQHVAKLERIMGTRLLVRRRDGLELTRAGHELFAVSDRLRTLEQLIEERVANYSAFATGHLVVIAERALSRNASHCSVHRALSTRADRFHLGELVAGHAATA